ncbi:hypothetical protein ACH4T9_31300 [Micromonospora sp. NPDC020750]|uniref:hypothetical protein n=1 Tax=unclassified Micromonospora TaxID=2617518 RepID=UPI0037872A0C
MIGLLTSDQVATIAGIGRTHVFRWTARRGISHIRIPGDPRLYYPASPVHTAAAYPAALRLARFIRNPLNH